MLHLPITRSWILSLTAQRVYFACAIANLYFLIALTATRVVFHVAGPPSVVTVKILLWPGIAGSSVLAVAMWYFWFKFDQSHWVKRALWFPVLFLGITVGPALYYFFSYRRHAGLDCRATNDFGGTSGPK